MQRIEKHFFEDDFEIREITFFLAQESGQQKMGEFDRALLSIRDDEDDINLREQSAEHLHPLKRVSVRSRENRDGIRFDRHPESFPEVIQSFEDLYLTFRDYIINGRLQSLYILIILT